MDKPDRMTIDNDGDHAPRPHPTDPVSGPAVLGSCAILERPQPMSAPQFIGMFSPMGHTAAVILAGGSGDRFGRPGGKQIFEIAGRPLLSWSIAAFDEVEEVGLIVVVCHPDRIDEYRELAVEPFGFVTPVVMVAGGDIRQESAFNGVAAVPDTFEFIAVHDGARPLVSPKLINHAINVLKGSVEAAGAVVGHPSIDTLKVVEGETIAGTPDRSLFWVAQTPQVFRADILRRAYMVALAEGFVGTDDSSLVERLNERVLIVEGPRDNIKVTVPEDKATVESALLARLSYLG